MLSNKDKNFNPFMLRYEWVFFMNYQIELFEEKSIDDLQKNVNDFLMLLTADRIVKIDYKKSSVSAKFDYDLLPFTAMVVYTYGEK